MREVRERLGEVRRWLTAVNSAVILVGYEKSLVLRNAAATDIPSDNGLAYTKLVTWGIIRDN